MKVQPSLVTDTKFWTDVLGLSTWGVLLYFIKRA